MVPVFCRELAEATGGKFHHFSPIKEEGIFESTDIALLLDEIRAASGWSRLGLCFGMGTVVFTMKVAFFF